MIQKARLNIDHAQTREGLFRTLRCALCIRPTVVPAPDFVGKSGAADAAKKNPEHGATGSTRATRPLGQIMESLERHRLADNTPSICDCGQRQPAGRGRLDRRIEVHTMKAATAFRWSSLARSMSTGSVNHDTMMFVTI